MAPTSTDGGLEAVLAAAGAKGGALADALVGRTLGEFVVREKLGEGGFGAVYRAEQPLLAREAVIKVLHRHVGEHELGVKRFLLEARLASRLDHPYAAHIYAFGVEPDGLLWIAMELVRGTGLDRLLRAKGPLELERLVPLLEKLCEVVHTAHEQGIVHRDLKPANVLVLVRAGRLLPKLLDLGIAKLVPAPSARAATPPPVAGATPPVPPADDTPAGPLDETAIPDGSPPPGAEPTPALTQAGAIMGSPRYMAPEQWIDPAGADARTDIYALGILAYEALTGAPPFSGRSHLEIATAHARAPVPPLPAALPAALNQVLARALAKDPAERFATTLELAAAFRAASGLEATPAEQLPALDEPVRAAALTDAPQPLAEAVAALAAARNPHQARDAVREIARVVVRLLGVIALASHARSGAGERLASGVAEALRRLRRGELDDEGWLELSRELCRPFARLRDAHPVPELVALFFHGAEGEERGSVLDGLVAALEAGAHGLPAEQVREHLERSVRALSRVLRAVSFLGDYPLVAVRGGHAEAWMGVRRPRRAVLELRGARPDEGHPALLDASGRPVLSLWPLAQIAAPSPGAPDELFLFEGKGRRGARLVALPHAFERHDEEVWGWFAGALADTLDDTLGGGGGKPAEAPAAPYAGLAAFTAADGERFFGREQEVEAFLNRLRGHALLAVVGPSGAGKSSFVQAGVLPALPAGWRHLTVRPGEFPLTTLCARLRAAGYPVGDDDAPAAIAAAMAGYLAAAGGVQVLVVDQLEELFTLCHDAAARTRYVEVLTRVARVAEDPVRVIVTLRDDFLVRAQQLPALRDRLAQGLQLLATPAREDLLRIVIEPARRAGYEFDDAQLPALMVDAVDGQPGALPLLSFAASRLWELRDRHFKQLPRKAYEAMGGVGGALAQHAEATLAAMSADEQRLVREAFRHLVTAEGTRAVLSRSELVQVTGGGARAEHAVEQLVSARLLVASEDDAGGERIEVVHEALLAAWPRLVEWRQQDAEGARLRDQLRAAARQWHERGRPRGLLWRDEALTELTLWRRRFPGVLTEVEASFAAASTADAARGRRLRRGLFALAFAALAVFLLLQVRATQATRSARGLAERRADEARQLLADSYVEQGRHALLDGKHAEALAYLGEAVATGADTPAVRFMLARAMATLSPQRQVFRGGHGMVWSAALSPDGTRLVTGDDAGAAIWDPATGTERLRLAIAPASTTYHVSFSPDGRQVLTASEDGHARLWDAETGRLASDFIGETTMWRALLSHDGRWLVGCSSLNGRAFVWDRRDPAAAPRVLEGGGGGGSACDLSPDQRLLAVAGGGNTARIFRLDTGERVSEITHEDWVNAVRFHPGGAWLATSSWDGTAGLWEVATGRRLLTLAAHGDKLEAVGLSPDGTAMVTAGRDGTARVWELPSGRARAVLRGHRSAVRDAAFTPSSRRIVTASDDGRIAVWDAATGLRAEVFEGHTAQVGTPQLTADERTLVTPSWDGTARTWALIDSYRAGGSSGPPGCTFDRWLTRAEPMIAVPCAASTAVWSLAGGDRVVTLPGAAVSLVRPDGARVFLFGADAARIFALPSGQELDRLDDPASITTAAWSPSGELAVGRSSGQVDLVTPGRPRRRLEIAEGRISGLVFTREGSRLLVSEAAPALHVVDVGAGRALGPAHATSAAFIRFTWSRAGDRLVGVPEAGSPELWDVNAQRRLAVLEGHAAPVFTATFSADDRWLVTASGDGTARLWDAHDGRPVRSFTGSPQFLSAAELDERGQLLVATGGDGHLRFWDVASGRMLWALPAHPSFAVDVRFVSDDRLVSRSSAGDVSFWRVPRRPVEEDLAGYLRCRAPLVFDHAGRDLRINTATCTP